MGEGEGEAIQWSFLTTSTKSIPDIRYAPPRAELGPEHYHHVSWAYKLCHIPAGFPELPAGTLFLQNTEHRNGRNGLSYLHLAFVRNSRKKHGQTARNSLIFCWGFLFAGTKRNSWQEPSPP
jgi:hypothetical protein